MVCIVITRNGRGSAFLFKDKKDARLNPLTQVTDVFASDAAELLRQYGRDETETLLRFTEGRDRSRLVDALETWRTSRNKDVSCEVKEILWTCVQRIAAKPPSEPTELLRMISEDRVALEGLQYRSRPEGDNPATPTKVERVRTMTENTETKAPTKRISNEAVITVVSETNPKREGTPSHERFALYRTGMTAKEAKEAGVRAADISYDLEKGFISVVEPEPKADEATADAGEAATGADTDNGTAE